MLCEFQNDASALCATKSLKWPKVKDTNPETGRQVMAMKRTKEENSFVLAGNDYFCGRNMRLLLILQNSFFTVMNLTKVVFHGISNGLQPTVEAEKPPLFEALL